MKRNLMLFLFLSSLFIATHTNAQPTDSATLAKSEKRISENLKDVHKHQRKIDRSQKRIEKQQSKINRQERRRERKMKGIEKEQKKINDSR
jgi:peptidoglycan hydrolase CwlO-like protein